MKLRKIFVDWFVLPVIGITIVLIAWSILSSVTINPQTKIAILPSPTKTWEVSRLYLGFPADGVWPEISVWAKSRLWLEKLFEKRGELDQGIGAFTILSMVLVFKGYMLGLIVGTPLGFLLGKSKLFARIFDPIIQVLRPVSPLAWLPLGFLIFRAVQMRFPDSKVNIPELASIFTIAVCAMWPTVLNTAVGVRAIPQDYLNVARVLRLSRTKTLFKILIPATLPYMFTGFRLSLGIAWLVIVAVEMLTGQPGVGGFLSQEYISGVSEHIILCIIVIGIVGFFLDRLMSLVEANVQHIMNAPALVRRLVAFFLARRRTVVQDVGVDQQVLNVQH